MIQIETTLRNWGNSVGVVIPKDALKKNKLQPNDVVKVIINKKDPIKVGDIFGIKKDWKTPTDEIVKSGDEALESKYFR